MHCLCNITSYLQPAQAVDMLHTNLAFDRTNDVAFLGVYNAPAYVSLRPLRCPSSHSLQPSGKSTTRICQSPFWIMPTICDVVLHSSTGINFQLPRLRVYEIDERWIICMNVRRRAGATWGGIVWHYRGIL